MGRPLRLRLGLLALLFATGCSRGTIRGVDYRRDLPRDTLDVIRKNPWEFTFVESTSAMPMLYLTWGELARAIGVQGWRAASRGIYLSGFLAQRFYDADFDPAGRNLSYRITELWLVGLFFRWDEVKWRVPDCGARYYLDATTLFGAFGYSRDGDNRDVVLLWLPIPLPLPPPDHAP